MYKLSEMFGQRGGSDAFGRRAVKNIGIRTDIGQTFAESGTTSHSVYYEFIHQPVIAMVIFIGFTLIFVSPEWKCDVQRHRYTRMKRSRLTHAYCRAPCGAGGIGHIPHVRRR